MVVDFKNEPGIDFTVQENVDKFKETLKKVEGELGQDIPLVIDGKNQQKINLNLSIQPKHLKPLLKSQKQQKKM